VYVKNIIDKYVEEIVKEMKEVLSCVLAFYIAHQ
jgi:hypothetical protein